tara:strand:- start:271 stop:858 length:588 start_codon:yes stop_codon:yes gene_type:complete
MIRPDRLSVMLERVESERAIDHGFRLSEKIHEHQKTRGWYTTSQRGEVVSLDVLCTNGILAEYAFRKLIGVYVPEAIFIELDYFDGGADVIARRKSDGSTMVVQVKSANPREAYKTREPYLLSAKSNPISKKADVAVLAIPWDETHIDFVGAIPVPDFLKKSKPFPMDPTCKAVAGDKLRSMASLLETIECPTNE